jgi:NLI interacting factor-like phosphatase
MTETPAAGAKTPPRHNYANPHTPIASIKRPRSSLERPVGPTRGQLTSPAPGVQPAESSDTMTPLQRRSSSTDEASLLSPMHPPKAVHRDAQDHVEAEDDSSWVGRKVDALFSPVLTFLNHAQQENGSNAVTDEDIAMDDRKDDDTQPTASTSSSTMTSSPRGDGSLGLDDEEEHSVCDSLAAVEHDHSGDEEEFNPWQFIKSLPEYRFVQHLCPPVTLPPKNAAGPTKTLVLDLDETLVHCTVESVENADLTFPVHFHGMTYTVHVRLRPHLYTFLEKIRGKFEVIVFTASQKVYANELLNRIDPGMW